MIESRKSLGWFGGWALSAAAACFWAGPASAESITIGTYDDGGNSIPFGANNDSTGSYQQLYASSSFSGPISIDSVAFASRDTEGTSTETITIGFSTSSATLTTISSNLATNRGADYTTVYSGTYTFTSAGSGAFDLVFATSPFVYDPSMGNLLMDVNVTAASGGTGSFEATNDPVTSRAYVYPGAGVNDDYGLVTQFGFTPASVPEPGSIVLLAIGLLGGLGMANCRRLIAREALRCA